ncbi:Uncharacterised protein [Vibrio cholerae]|nr:Uncharacterised protein [Vibrio cholerae]
MLLSTAFSPQPTKIRVEAAAAIVSKLFRLNFMMNPLFKKGFCFAYR